MQFLCGLGFTFHRAVFLSVQQAHDSEFGFPERDAPEMEGDSYDLRAHSGQRHALWLGRLHSTQRPA